MGETASQPAFKASIRVLVASKEEKSSENGVRSIISTASIFIDEYNNALDNPQFWEDAFSFIFTPLRYF